MLLRGLHQSDMGIIWSEECMCFVLDMPKFTEWSNFCLFTFSAFNTQSNAKVKLFILYHYIIIFTGWNIAACFYTLVEVLYWLANRNFNCVQISQDIYNIIPTICLSEICFLNNSFFLSTRLWNLLVTINITSQLWNLLLPSI